MAPELNCDDRRGGLRSLYKSFTCMLLVVLVFCPVIFAVGHLNHETAQRTPKAKADYVSWVNSKIPIFSKKTNESLEEIDNKSKLPTITVTDKIKSRSLSECINKPSVCDTPECKSRAGRILNRMDHSTDFCEDFYTFACAGNPEKPGTDRFYDYDDAEIAETLLRAIAALDYSQDAFGKYKQFYDSCTDWHFEKDTKERVEKVKSILHDRGMDTDNCQNISFEELLSNSIEFNSLPVMFIDLPTGKPNVLQIHLPQTAGNKYIIQSAFLSGQERCLSEQRSKMNEAEVDYGETYALYSDCMRKSKDFENLLRDALEIFGFNPSGEATNQTLEIIESLRQIYPNLSNINGNDDTADNHKRVSFDELKNKFPELKSSKLLLGRSITSSEKIYNFFHKFLSIVTKSSHGKVFLQHLILTNFYYNFLMVPQRQSTELYCLEKANTVFKTVASQLYATHQFSTEQLREGKQFIEDIFPCIKEELASHLEDDIATKLNDMQLVFEESNYTTADETYDALDVFISYPTNVVLAQEFLNTRRGSKDNIAISMHEKYPKSYEGVNKVFVPMIFLLTSNREVVMFHLVKAIIYQYLSTIENQTVSNLDSELKELLQMMNYDFSFKFDYSNKLLRDKMIPDIFALQLTEDAYKTCVNINEPTSPKALVWISDDYSFEQFSYIVIAQEFCEKLSPAQIMLSLIESNEPPAILRVNTILQKSRNFGNTFNCAEGSKMNREQNDLSEIEN